MKRLKRCLEYVAYALGFCGAITYLFFEQMIEPFRAVDVAPMVKPQAIETVELSALKQETQPMPDDKPKLKDFSIENLHRNIEYLVTERDGRQKVCFFDTVVRNNRRLLAVFTSKRGGKGNVVVCATSAEIESAIPINAEKPQNDNQRKPGQPG